MRNIVFAAVYLKCRYDHRRPGPSVIGNYWSAAVKSRCYDDDATAVGERDNRELRIVPRSVEMHTKLLLGSALLLWLFRLTRPRYGYFQFRPFGWGHV